MKVKSKRYIINIYIICILFSIFFINDIQVVTASNPPYHIHLTYGTGNNADDRIHVTWFTSNDQAESLIVWDTISHLNPSDYAYSAIGNHT